MSEPARNTDTLDVTEQATLRAAVGRALPIQLLWGVLAATWNFAGVILIGLGQRPLGPTATLAGAFVLLAMAAGFVATVNRWPIVYLLISVAAAIFGLGAVWNALTADPALWPSEFWRIAGAILNAFGGAASLVAIAALARWWWSRE